MGSCCDWSSPLKRGIRTHTLDPLYGAPEQRISLAAPFAFDVFSLALIGIRVLLPAYASEARLRELLSRLAPLNYDLYAYREAARPGVSRAGGAGAVSGTGSESGMNRPIEPSNGGVRVGIAVRPSLPTVLLTRRSGSPGRSSRAWYGSGRRRL